MSQTIYKYPLAVTDQQTVNMPAGAQPLAVQVQHGQPCLWALVRARKVVGIAPRLVPFTVNTYGTGHVVPDEPGRYVGTYQLSGGALVFHVFIEEQA